MNGKEIARIIGRPVANEAPNAGEAIYFSALCFRSVFEWFHGGLYQVLRKLVTAKADRSDRTRRGKLDCRVFQHVSAGQRPAAKDCFRSLNEPPIHWPGESF
jgi:hypothetical protein